MRVECMRTSGKRIIGKEQHVVKECIGTLQRGVHISPGNFVIEYRNVYLANVTTVLANDSMIPYIADPIDAAEGYTISATLSGLNWK